MIGAIIGDIVGSRFEFNNTNTKDFELFTNECTYTDDTVLTCAVADAIMACEGDYEYLYFETIRSMRNIGRKHPDCGYGSMFSQWLWSSIPEPYDSCGNGAAMRISPCGEIATSGIEVGMMSLAVTSTTHNHYEGLKGAEAVARAIYHLNQGEPKEVVRDMIERNYYRLPYTVKDYRKQARGHGLETCQVSVPQAFVCFFEGNDFEDVIRNSISIGGDSDTVAAIAGSLAEATYPIPDSIKTEAMLYIPWDLQDIVRNWYRTL